ncbi:hypothetical protein [Pedobacter gandavensis]|uniref:hypothetical protein n=1 Tax=Pedobacter gandavensis TaxID=2679963 RepID=UPI00292EBF6E|nr:hypothetical protein [Pedobacter gandavensis]
MNKTISTLFWILFVCGIGLIQLAIIYICSFVNGDSVFDINRFYSDGFFLFFSISLIAGIFYEFQYESQCLVNKYLKNTLLLTCVTIEMFAMLVYAIAYVSKISSTSEIGNYIILQNFLTGSSIILASVMKGIIYYNR